MTHYLRLSYMMMPHEREEVGILLMPGVIQLMESRPSRYPLKPTKPLLGDDYHNNNYQR